MFVKGSWSIYLRIYTWKREKRKEEPTFCNSPNSGGFGVDLERNKGIKFLMVVYEIHDSIPVYINNWLVYWFDDKELLSGADASLKTILKKKKKVDPTYFISFEPILHFCPQFSSIFYIHVGIKVKLHISFRFPSLFRNI